MISGKSKKTFFKMKKRKDIICLGELLIDMLAVQSATRFEDVTEFRRVAGGAPANVAVGGTKMGLDTAFIGRVGNDKFGKYLAGILLKNGVDISQLQYDDEARTGLAFISIPTPDTREFLFYRNPSADMRLDPGELDKGFIEKTKIFHFGSISLIDEPSRTATYEAIKAARSAGAVISYDPNLRTMLWPSLKQAKEQIRKAIPLADIIKVNFEELKLIANTDDMNIGSGQILSMGPKICMVTLGNKGSFSVSKDFKIKIPAYKVKVVEATGCGDSFVSGVLTGIIENGFERILSDRDRLTGVLKFASAAAAITSTDKGVIPVLPRKEDVLRFIAGNDINIRG